MLPLLLSTPRHKSLIRDVVQSDKLLGVVALPPVFFGQPEATPRAGAVGCVARVVSLKKIPRKQLRIVVEGIERFAVQALVESEHYAKAEIAPYIDMEESLPLLTTFAEEVRTYYSRYLRASGKIADDAREAAAQLPDDPREMSMVLPALLNLDEETSQRFLASRSSLMRLRELSAILAPAASGAEAGAEAHAKSRTNGHGATRS
jgi:Lon protease-like protein